MILTAFTLFHVLISLVAIGSGFVVVAGLLGSKPPGGSTTLFWTTAVATTVTGFFFPFHGFTPAIGGALFRRSRWRSGSLPCIVFGSLEAGVAPMRLAR
jgi:hypothetical protein